MMLRKRRHSRYITNSTSCEEQYVKNHRNFVMYTFLTRITLLERIYIFNYLYSNNIAIFHTNMQKFWLFLMRSSPNAKSAKISSLTLAYISLKFIPVAICTLDNFFYQIAFIFQMYIFLKQRLFFYINILALIILY